MKNILSAIWSEGLKVRRSKILWLTILFYLFIPLMIGVLIFVQKNPEISSKLGLIGMKSTMLSFGEANWFVYFGLFDQLISAIGIVGFGFVTSWVFGREYSDRTVGDLLALPTSRSSIILSKFIIVVIWCLLLSFILFAFGLVVGKMIQLSGWSGEIVFHQSVRFTITALLVVLLCTPVAFFASYGRGYLLPIGFVILTLITAQFIGLIGLAPYFPWAIPALYSGAAGTESEQIGMVSYLILFLTGIFGFIATMAWWRYADQY